MKVTVQQDSQVWKYGLHPHPHLWERGPGVAQCTTCVVTGDISPAQEDLVSQWVKAGAPLEAAEVTVGGGAGAGAGDPERSQEEKDTKMAAGKGVRLEGSQYIFRLNCLGLGNLSLC